MCPSLESGHSMGKEVKTMLYFWMALLVSLLVGMSVRLQTSAGKGVRTEEDRTLRFHKRHKREAMRRNRGRMGR
jgi:hypothetical protein